MQLIMMITNNSGSGAMGNNLLITFASWEDRFRLGTDRNLKKFETQKTLVFYFNSYSERTEENRNTVEEICKGKDIEYVSKRLDVNKPAENWSSLLESVDDAIQDKERVLVDISTMPREIIWYVLWQIEQSSATRRYIYYSPESYGHDWLSRDPQPPRLVYKLSGIASPAAKTALLVAVGFDWQRVKRLINWYEPAKLMIGLQSKSQFEQNNTKKEEYRDILEKENDGCEIFDLDAFAEDRGMGTIQEKLDKVDSSYNVIMSSLGPKLTAISLYKLQRQRQERGLVYAPSNQFSHEYSSGIGECFEGNL